MLRLAVPVLACGFIGMFSGCGNSALLGFSDSKNGGSNKAEATGGVAVIDVDVVAKELGRYERISKSVTERESSLNRQLSDIQGSYRSQVEREERALDTTANDAEKQKVDQLRESLNNRLLQARSEAQKDLQKYRASLVNQFRDEVKPIAQQVASGKGLSLVVSRNDNVVFSFEPAIDITQDVVVQMKSRTASTDNTTSPK